MSAGEATNVTAPARPRVRFLDLLFGLPAVVTAVVLVATLARQGRKEGQLADAYLKNAFERIKVKDHAGASVVVRRALQLSPDREDLRLLLAMELEQLGDINRAEALARTIAPPDGGKGFTQAHFWLGQRLVVDNRGSAHRLQEAEKHLLACVKADPKNGAAKLQLGNLYVLMGRHKDARPYLESLAEGSPEILLNLAIVCQALGDEEESRRRIDQAVAITRQIVARNPTNVRARAVLAKALVGKKDFTGALDVMKSVDSGKDPKAKEALDRNKAAICTVWADTLTRSNKADPAEVLAAIEQGLDFVPDDVGLLARLAELLKGKGPEAEKARARFEKMLAEGKAPELAHLSLGNEAWGRGRNAEARSHWEKAVVDKPFIPLAANNLAWDLAYNEPADPNRALDLIDKALNSVPGDPRFRGTRGQVLAKLGRWKDAQSDLEGALDGGVTSGTLHKALADTYEHLGMIEKAAEHRKKAG